MLSSRRWWLATPRQRALLHEQAYRALGNDGRFRIALELSDLTHTFAVAGIRLRHPEWSDDSETRQ
jgi:hypothetical protein